jgi:hypothetical protein
MAGLNPPQVIETVLRQDEWLALPSGFGRMWLHLSDPNATVLAHLGPVDTPPTLNETMVFVCPRSMSLKSLAPDRTVYLRASVGSVAARIDLDPAGASSAHYGISPFKVPEDEKPATGVTGVQEG